MKESPVSEREPFSDDRDGIDAEIEANEERRVQPSEPSLERTLDDAIRPFTDDISSDELTPEERAERVRENNRGQEPE